MTNQETKLCERLTAMTGRTFLYKTKPVKVLSFRVEAGICTLVTTDRHWLTLPIKDMMLVLPDFLEMEEDEPSVALSRPAPDVALQASVQVESLSVFSALKEALLDNIQKVQHDKGYVSQAQVVSHSVKMVIELAKTEIAAVKMMHEIRRK